MHIAERQRDQSATRQKGKNSGAFTSSICLSISFLLVSLTSFSVVSSSPSIEVNESHGSLLVYFVSSCSSIPLIG